MDTETREQKALGPRLVFSPARPPERQALVGRYGQVVPVDPGRHAHDLYEASHGAGGDPGIWNYLGYGPFSDEATFARWVAERAASQDPLFFAVIDAGGRALGMASYLRIVP